MLEALKNFDVTLLQESERSKYFTFQIQPFLTSLKPFFYNLAENFEQRKLESNAVHEGTSI